MSRHIAHYTLVRLLPQPDAGEFANIGVVIGCPAAGFFNFLLITRHGRVTRFFEEFTGDLFIQVRHEVTAELAHLRQQIQARQQASGLREESLIRRVIEDLAQPRETMIRYAPPRIALTTDPKQLLDEVFARYVQRDRQESDKRRESVLDQQIRRLLRQQDSTLYRNFRRDTDVGTGDFSVPFPLVHFHDDRPRAAIKALDLTQSDPQKIYDHGGWWAERLRRLHRKKAMPEGVLITVETPGVERDRCHRASLEILEELQELPAVYIARIDQPEHILDFARAHVH